MKLTTKRKEQISSVLIICLGNILNAFSARVFLLPADLVAGGTTGIGLILQRITGIPLSSLAEKALSIFPRQMMRTEEICSFLFVVSFIGQYLHKSILLI